MVGQGIKDLQAFILVKISKQDWRLVTGIKRLFYQHFTGQYFPYSNLLNSYSRIEKYATT